MESLPSVAVLLILLLITVLILCCPTIVDFGLDNEALINNEISSKIVSADSSEMKIVEFSSSGTKKHFDSFRSDTNFRPKKFIVYFKLSTRARQKTRYEVSDIVYEEKDCDTDILHEEYEIIMMYFI